MQRPWPLQTPNWRKHDANTQLADAFTTERGENAGHGRGSRARGGQDPPSWARAMATCSTAAGQARRPPSRSVSSRPASPPKRRNRQQAERGYTRSNTTASGLSARDGKSGRPKGRPVFYYSPVSVDGNNQNPCEERSNTRSKAGWVKTGPVMRAMARAATLPVMSIFIFPSSMSRTIVRELCASADGPKDRCLHPGAGARKLGPCVRQFTRPKNEPFD